MRVVHDIVGAGVGPFGVVFRHSSKHQRRIANRACQRTHMIEAQAQWHDAAGADKSVARLQSYYATVGRWNTHRTAGIGAQRRRAQSRCDGGRRATARAAGRVTVTIRICCASKMRVVVDSAKRTFLHVELAENHSACGSQALNHSGIGTGRSVYATETVGGRDPGDIDVVFDGDGNAVESAQALLALGSLSCLLGLSDRALAT